MKPGPVAAANAIHSVLEIEDPPISTRDLLKKIIVYHNWAADIDPAEKAEMWHDRFVSRLRYLLERTIKDGDFLTYQFNSSGSGFVQGACYCEPSENPDVANAKKRRSNTQNVYQSCKAVSASDFEKLSGKILQLLNVEKSYVSRKSADQGIDFFGRVPIGEMLKPSLLDSGAEKHMVVWIVGQAKHYPETKVGTSEIRELVGSVDLARSKIFAGKLDPLSDLQVRLCDPIIYMFFTTGRFTKDSKELLQRSGVQSFEGLQIAQFIADHGIAVVDGIFDPDEFQKWLNDLNSRH